MKHRKLSTWDISAMEVALRNYIKHAKQSSEWRESAVMDLEKLHNVVCEASEMFHVSFADKVEAQAKRKVRSVIPLRNEELQGDTSFDQD